MADDHPPALPISPSDIPIFEAFDVDAERVECVPNTFVSIPEACKKDKTQRAIVFEETGL